MSQRQKLDDEFAAFVAAQSHSLLRKAWLLTTSRHQAEDLVQSALAKTYAAWQRVRRADDPVAYTHAIVTKTFLSDRRRRSSTELPVAEPVDTATADEAADATDRLMLMAALRQLDRLDRAVVVLRYWDDRSVAETARQLDLTEAAVKNRSLRALRALRADLQSDPHLSDSHLSDLATGSNP